MIFFAILLALLIEQAHPLSVDNPVFAGLRSWARLVRRNLDTGQVVHGWVAWVLATAGPALLAALLYWMLWRFSTVLSFVWLVLVLYVTLGFRQFSHHFTDIRQALEEGNDAQAREKLAQWLHVETSSLPRAELLRQVIEQSVLAAHRHVFGVLACFVVFWLLGLAARCSTAWPSTCRATGGPVPTAAEARRSSARARRDGAGWITCLLGPPLWALRWSATLRKRSRAGAASPSVSRRAVTVWCWPLPRGRST